MSVSTEPLHAGGTTLSYKIGAATAFTALGQVADISLGGIKIPEIKTSKLSSTVHTSIPSIVDPGDVKFSMYYVPGDAGVQAIQGLATTPAIVAWQIQSPDGASETTGSTITFSAFVTDFAPKDYKIDGTPMVDVSLKITGAIAFAAGS
jgi:hypothetical protein